MVSYFIHKYHTESYIELPGVNHQFVVSYNHILPYKKYNTITSFMILQKLYDTRYILKFLVVFNYIKISSWLRIIKFKLYYTISSDKLHTQKSII